MKRTTCRHCDRRKRCRPRGRCWGCYYRPGIKERCPSTSKYAHRGVCNLTGIRPLPATPTPTVPGSEGKIAIPAERAARGEVLHHPGDLAV
jgi:hypothetical protein